MVKKYINVDAEKKNTPVCVCFQMTFHITPARPTTFHITPARPTMFHITPAWPTTVQCTTVITGDDRSFKMAAVKMLFRYYNINNYILCWLMA